MARGEVVIPLGLANIDTLTKQLTVFARELQDTVKVDIEQATCAVIANDVRGNIANIQDVDGNYLGANPAAVTVEVGLPGHDVIWTGKQIAYLEFGTGAKGAAGAYPGVAMAQAGYHPDPTKAMWLYPNGSGGTEVSHGLEPQVPMLKASIEMRRGRKMAPARAVLKGALRRAITV